jgi:hypothetical protein
MDGASVPCVARKAVRVRSSPPAPSHAPSVRPAAAARAKKAKLVAVVCAMLVVDAA